jgi:pSer/pThr/pTyr-binding forkhead associated (FHA) protein
MPAGFRVDVSYVKARPAAWPPGAPFHIEYLAGGTPPRAAQEPRRPPALKLTVLRGTAARPSYVFAQAVIRFGRSESPVDERGRVRRNDVAFVEDDAPSRTVGRGHCEIRFDAETGQYRVFDERSANGTRIVRGGEVIEVPARDPLGVALAAGDELQLGQAAVRITMS